MLLAKENIYQIENVMNFPPVVSLLFIEPTIIFSMFLRPARNKSKIPANFADAYIVKWHQILIKFVYRKIDS